MLPPRPHSPLLLLKFGSEKFNSTTAIIFAIASFVVSRTQSLHLPANSLLPPFLSNMQNMLLVHRQRACIRSTYMTVDAVPDACITYVYLGKQTNVSE